MKKVCIAGIIGLVSISPLFRGLFYSYETYGFLALIALLMVIYFLYKIVKREKLHINRLYIMAGLLLLAGIALSFSNALNPRATFESVLLYAELIFVFIVLYDYFYEKKQVLIQAIMLPAIAAGTAGAFTGLLAMTGRFFIWQVTTDGNRLGSTFQYANTAAIYFLICYIFAVTQINIIKNPILKALIAGMGNTLFFAFLMTGSRGGYFMAVMLVLLVMTQPRGMKLGSAVSMICSAAPVFIVMKSFTSSTAAHDNLSSAKWIIISFAISAAAYFVIGILKKILFKKVEYTLSKRAKTGLIISISVCAVVVFVFRNSLIQLLPPVMVKRIERLIEYGIYDNNILARLEFYKDSLKLIASHWLFGLGGGGWEAAYHSVQDFNYTANLVHNNYLQLFVDHGVLGFLSYLCLVLISASSAVYSYLKAKDRLLKSCASGLLCSFLALAVHSAFDFDLTYISLALLFWVMFAASSVDLPVENVGSGNKKRRHFDNIFRTAFADRWKSAVNGSLLKLFLVIICSALFSLHSLYFAAAYNGNIADYHMHLKNYKEAMIYYEEANRLDPSNSNYTSELARIYEYYGRKSTREDYKKIWLDKAYNAATISMKGKRCFAPNVETLVFVYLDSGKPLEAVQQSEYLVSLQKYNADGYELLARSYIEAAIYCKTSGDLEKARELLVKCIDIDKNPYLRRSGISKVAQIGSGEIISGYRHSSVLLGHLKKALEILENIK